jgi:hypothetical protein
MEDEVPSLSLLRCAGVVAAIALLSSGCATHRGPDPLPMETCATGAKPAGVDAAALSAALVEAQRYSNKVYGPDCFVCAEVFDDTKDYMLHITSPLEDMLINTSAAITVRKSDGAVIDRGIWHSCHARVTAKSSGTDE